MVLTRQQVGPTGSERNQKFKLARGLALGLSFHLQIMPRDEFENDEAQPGAEGEGGVEEEEIGGGPFLEEATDPADHGVGGEEGEVIEADDRGVDRFRRVFREER